MAKVRDGKRPTMWTQRDYEMVASILKKADPDTTVGTHDGLYDPESARAMRLHIAEQFAYKFKKDNERFKSHVFYHACGVFPQEDK